ncbi:S-adenosyl-L-methionine-dependent methyltransferase [Diplogelasinospora grovesii]|uniref:tRNA (guanine(26)-N(2))-dimethyltransferase n=1 Tax=Diplogelasinospora grovesii TaxID=303347 RepID=A0AAN6N0F0_9PEZI|nr:S-adenosyl-L-methionine-dependent methyltransferase [Diplogelasinospora grovesii]
MASEAQSISAPPAHRQTVLHDGKRYTTVQEGLAYILVPESTDEEKKLRPDQGVREVFYNPIQQFNRDLTVLAIKAYGKERIEQKQVAKQRRSNKFAEQKRKRKEQLDGERPAKAPKLSDDAAADGQTNGATVTIADSAMVDAKEEETESGAAVPPVENGAGEAADAEAETSKDKNALPFTILDALSASGLRALRYAHEIPFVTSVTSNDLLQSAVESIKINVEHNKLESKIRISHDDAIAHMYSLIAKELRQRDAKGKPVKSEKYDVIDLDPYGTAAPFLDAAVQAVRDDGGLLCVTCTDSGVWASNGYPEKCYSLYGGVPLKGWYSHEVGLRLVLHAIESSAAKYGLAIEPLLSLSIDFYVRIFVRIRKSPASVKFQGGKNMVVYSCDQGCGAWTTQLLMKNKAAQNKKGSGVFYKHGFAHAPTTNSSCEHCGSTMHLAGPMYAGRIHSPDFVRNVLAELQEAPTEIYGTTDRIEGMLQTALEEILLSPEEEAAKEKQAEAAKEGKKDAAAQEAELAAVDPYPFYFHPAKLSGTLSCVTPPEDPIKGALKGLGYRVTRSHCKPGSIKTDAPWSVIWHVMREWVRQRAPVKEENIKPGSAGYRLLRLGEKKADAPEPTENGAAEQNKASEPEVVFDEKLGRDPEKKKLVRYQQNPRENWGPLNRAKGH